MTLLDGLAPIMPDAPMTADDFRALHWATQDLIASGIYDTVWPSARRAYLEVAADFAWDQYIGMIAEGKWFQVH